MKNFFDQMSSNSIGLTGAAFALAVEHKVFREYLVENGVLTIEDIITLQDAAFATNISVLRHCLNKINNFMEDITS